MACPTLLVSSRELSTFCHSGSNVSNSSGPSRYATLCTLNRSKHSQKDQYEATLKECSHQGDISGAEALLCQMQHEGTVMTVAVYNLVINACVKSGNPWRALEHLRMMQQFHGMQPDTVTYNSIINSCAMKGDVNGVQVWVDRMVAAGVSPNAITYGTICKAFARCGHVDRIESIMDSVESAGIPLTEYFYATLISACGVAKPPRVDRAARALSELVRRGLRPSSVKSVLMRAVGRHHALKLLHETGKLEKLEHSELTRVSASPPSRRTSGDNCGYADGGAMLLGGYDSPNTLSPSKQDVVVPSYSACPTLGQLPYTPGAMLKAVVRQTNIGLAASTEYQAEIQRAAF